MNGQTPDGTEKARAARSGRMAQCAFLAAVCVLVIGVYVSSAKSGWLEMAGLNAANSYYNLLVQGFRAGQLSLKREVLPNVPLVADPYGSAAGNLNRTLADGPLHDLSCYQGKLYLYFGVTPALVLFWPWYELTRHYLLHRDAVVIFCTVGFLAGVGLFAGLRRRYFAGMSVGIMGACALAFGLVTGAPLLPVQSDVYEVAVSCGYMLAMLALVAIWQALHQAPRRNRWLVVASLAYGLAVGARPSLLLGAVILLVPVVLAWRERRQIWTPLLVATAPILLIGLLLLLYNLLRFGDPLEFGQRYQLSAFPQDQMEQFSLRYLWFNFRVGFLEPPRCGLHFPLVHDIVLPPLPRGYFEAGHAFGILSSMPFLWLALAAPLACRGRSGEAGSTLRWFLAVVGLLFGVCALTLCLHNSMNLRYEVEFAAPLACLAVVGVCSLERALTGQPGLRRAARWSWGLLLAFSVAFNILGRYEFYSETCHNLGTVALGRGAVDEAIAHFQKALEFQPDNPRAHNDLGETLLKMGRLNAAIAHFRKSLTIEPDHIPAHNNLGLALLQSGMVAEAVPHFRKVLEANPLVPMAHYNLANALLYTGQLDEAIRHYQKALELRPDQADAHNNLGYALLRKGQAREAIVHYQMALKIQPDSAGPCNNLAWVLATCPEASLRDGGRALELAQRASQLSGGQNPVMLKSLAAAYAEAGRFAEALTAARRALELARAQNNTALVNDLQAQIEVYRSGVPFRDPGQASPEAVPSLEPQ